MYIYNVTLRYTCLHVTHGIKVGDDLVEEAQTLEALVVDALLGVEVGEGGHTGEQDSNLGVALAVQVVVVTRVGQEVGRHVRR